MTIHASKGLQFDHVLVPYVSKNTRAFPLPLLACQEERGEDFGKWALSVPCDEEDGKKTHTVAANSLTQTLYEREDSESERIFYVALTRAKQSITLFYKNKKEKKSWLSKIPWDLQEGVHKREKYSYEVIREDGAPLEINRQKPSQKEEHLTKCHYWGEQERVSKFVSVTKDENTLSDIQKTLNIIEKAKRGNQFHQIFECLAYQELEQVQAMIEERFLGDEKKLLNQSLDYILNLKSPPVLKLIKQGFVEWGFLHQIDSSDQESPIIRGQIDLWGRDEKKNLGSRLQNRKSQK